MTTMMASKTYTLVSGKSLTPEALTSVEKFTTTGQCFVSLFAGR